MSTESAVFSSRDFWFQDGDIVLSCRGANGHIMRYRVHKFMLTQHSVPFTDMLGTRALAAAPDLEHTLDGLPVVPLPEPAVEIYKLLSCLYNALSGAAFQDGQRPITGYDGLLRICDKYQIAPLRQCVFARLKTEWPTTLAEWDAREAHIAVLRQQHLDARPSGRVHNLYLDDRLSEPVSIIGIARATGLLQLLPAAFYELARRDPRADWDVFHHPATRNLPANEQMLAQSMRSARWSALSAEDLLAFATSKERQLDCLRQLMGQMCQRELPHPLCKVERDKLVNTTQEIAILGRDPLAAARWACSQIATTTICQPCRGSTVHAFMLFRGSYWLALPTIFNHGKRSV
ncbi:hypothetical protein B0H17DRAFT_1199764 [Mycena rosella]|uniref:BTB domain-containing protein n=1 Tax=Mycena rosella TaxID=1033263 RepID=A0AAD7DME2_MYCRO|nr:hypothetical protein B0H17DRAFT_1199764 [Mycena rosella]